MKEQFLQELCKGMSPDARCILITFAGDPKDAPQTAWRGRPWQPGDPLPNDQRLNAYITLSSFTINDDGQRRRWRRHQSNFSAGHAFMIDDLGSGDSAKFPLSIIERLKPSALIETSPENFQAIYFFSKPVTDMRELKLTIKYFIQDVFNNEDPGMAGVTRVFRIPEYSNAKERYGQPWAVRLAAFNPELRYTLKDIREAYGLKEPPRPRQAGVDWSRAMRLAAGGERWPQHQIEYERKHFEMVVKQLREYGMIKSEMDNGWIDVRCPWLEHHSDGRNDGASISEPSEENGYNGGFKCHHGHCLEKTWRDLIGWLDEANVEALNDANITSYKNYLDILEEMKHG